MTLSPLVTMEALARAAGVSRSTVSRALHNDPRLRPETCARIRQLAAEVGYRPNPFVAALMADLKGKRQPRSSDTVAFVTAYDCEDGWKRLNPSFLDYFEGAKTRAGALGFAVEPFWLHPAAMTPERFVRILRTRNVHGLLIAPLPTAEGSLDLDWAGFASVAIGYTLESPQLSRAVTNFYQSMLLVMRQLLQMGFKRIGFVSNAAIEQRVQHAWLAGYLVLQQSLPASRRLPAYICPDLKGVGLGKWIGTHRPDAIIGDHSGVRDWILRAGLTMPQDLAFASLNAGRTNGDVAGIDQQSLLVGASAVDLLIGQLYRNERGVPATPMLTLIPGQWRDGASIGRP